MAEKKQPRGALPPRRRGHPLDDPPPVPGNGAITKTAPAKAAADGRKAITVRLPPEMILRLQRCKLESGRQIQDLVAEMLDGALRDLGF